MIDLEGKRLVHVTTADISLALLLGPQLRAFAAEGMEVIGVSAPGPFVPTLAEWGIDHVPLRHATRSVSPADDLAAFIELGRLFRRLRPDIVHTHNPKPGIYGRITARAAGVPGVVNTVHGLYAAPEDSGRRKAAVYALERLASTCSDVELFQNPEDLQVMRQLGVPERKLELLGNGVDLAQYRPPRSPAEVADARARLGAAPGATVVGLVGRLVWQKGFRELFAVARRMRVARPEVSFVIIGPHDAAKGDALDDTDIAGATDIGNITFLGHRDDISELYCGFDMFLLPSYREGFPRSAMEAAASGLPVVATDIRGCRQAVEDGRSGFLVPLHDVDALTQRIMRLADDGDLRTSMGANGRRKAEAEFDDREVIRRTLSAYRRLSPRRERR